MTKILLGQSYFLRFDPKLWEAMQPYPPLGTLHAASYLRKHGYEVALFDAMLAESEEDWARALDEHRPVGDVQRLLRRGEQRRDDGVGRDVAEDGGMSE